MFKNAIISALTTGLLFKISPYAFTKMDAMIVGVFSIVSLFVILEMVDDTIMEHLSYKQRRKFRKLIGMTTLR